MKKNKIYLSFAALLASLAFTACSPEDFEGVSESGLPVAENATVSAQVDQTTNTVTFTLEGTGQFPMWYIPVDGKEVTKNPVYSTTNPLQKIWTNTGDYTIYYRVGNHNGLSQGMGQATFHIDNSLTDYDELLGKLSAKEWRIAASESAHLACGESGTDGTNWWSASPNEKSATGMYDNRLKFGSDYSYTFNPGNAGTVFVNTGCTCFAGYGGSEDYTVPVEKQETTFSLSTEGDDLYITFPAGTLFPYIPANDAYTGELKLRIESLLGSTMVLVWDNGSIAWHYILTCSDEGFQGFDADSDCNLWKTCTYTNTFYYAPGWSQIADPTIEANGNNYTIALPEATTDQWQAQVFFHTDMTTNSVESYDFSCKITSNTDHNNVTVKLTKEDDDNVYFFADNIQLKANQEYIFYKSDMPGLDIDKVKLVFDFGGNAAGTKITVSSIDLKEHSCDDGRVAPAEEEDKTVYTYNSDSNLWKSHVDDKGEAGFTSFFYYAPGWAQIDDPTLSVDNGHYTLELPTATTDQWQAQFHMTTDIPGEADTQYDFSCKFMPTKDIKGVTVKLTDAADDNNFLFVNRYDLTAGVEYQVKVPASTLSVSAADALKLVFDFGGNPDGEKIDIYDIILQKTAL